jgi:aralkylamine dehydrogenase light chain/methylamine dehydrogenase light chain
MNWFDRWSEHFARRIAYSGSRRGFLVGVSKLLVGSAFIMPVLPIARAARPGTASHSAALEFPTDKELVSCEYWRYCGVDGFLCNCCGGTAESCPPGTEYSQVAWVGTCHNPRDGKDYMMSYHDCCGRTACDRCSCANEEGARPGYAFFRFNGVNWCVGNKNLMYNCTVSRMLGPVMK